MTREMRRSEANGDENDDAKRRRAGTNDRTDGVEPTPLRAAFFFRGVEETRRGGGGGRGVRNERDAKTAAAAFKRSETDSNKIDPSTTPRADRWRAPCDSADAICTHRLRVSSRRLVRICSRGHRPRWRPSLASSHRASPHARLARGFWAFARGLASIRDRDRPAGPSARDRPRRVVVVVASSSPSRATRAIRSAFTDMAFALGYGSASKRRGVRLSPEAEEARAALVIQKHVRRWLVRGGPRANARAPPDSTARRPDEISGAFRRRRASLVAPARNNNPPRSRSRSRSRPRSRARSILTRPDHTPSPSIFDERTPGESPHRQVPLHAPPRVPELRAR